MEVARFTIQDRAEREATRHEWEGKTWENIPQIMEPAQKKPHYKVRHYRPNAHLKRR